MKIPVICKGENWLTFIPPDKPPFWLPSQCLFPSLLILLFPLTCRHRCPHRFISSPALLLSAARDLPRHPGRTYLQSNQTLVYFPLRKFSFSEPEGWKSSSSFPLAQTKLKWARCSWKMPHCFHENTMPVSVVATYMLMIMSDILSQKKKWVFSAFFSPFFVLTNQSASEHVLLWSVLPLAVIHSLPHNSILKKSEVYKINQLVVEEGRRRE